MLCSWCFLVRNPKEKACNQLKIAGLSFLVRLAGIEPTTPWFVAKYSIQLSYSREALNSSII
jgi:hypothetical protein